MPGGQKKHRSIKGLMGFLPLLDKNLKRMQKLKVTTLCGRGRERIGRRLYTKLEFYGIIITMQPKTKIIEIRGSLCLKR